MEIARGSMTAVCATVDKTTGQLGAVAIPETIRAAIHAAPAEMLAVVSPK